jgi:aminoglycoside phosphotransferase
VHIIIKTTPKSIGRRKTFRSSEFFRSEIDFFNIVLKGFQEFQSVKKDAKYPFKEVATCLTSHLDGENDFLVVENLNPYGYFTTSRQQSMNIDVCRLIMRTLGRFHALSFVMRDQSPKKFEEFTTVFTENYYAQRLKPWYNDFIKTQIDIALDAVGKIYGGTIIEERAKKFLTEGSLYDKMVKFTHTTNRYSVIGHGDCWTPNFLIHSTKIDGRDVPVSAKMIDFQLARYASPVLDICFFIYSCTTEDLRAQYYDDLIKNYHESLCELIKDFGSNPDYLFPFSALEVSFYYSAN